MNKSKALPKFSIFLITSLVIFLAFVLSNLPNGSLGELYAAEVAAYGFEEGSGFTTADSSSNSNTGTISGATWTTSGKYGNALSFNGTSSRVDINDADSLDLGTGMTLEAWVNPTAGISVGNWGTVIYKDGASGGLVYALFLYNNGGNYRIWADINLGSTIPPIKELLGTIDIPLNTWTHLAATYDGTTFTVFVNGNPDQSLTQAGTITTSTLPLRIGGNTIFANEYFSGSIDEVRIYNTALSQAEIQTDMNTPVDTTAPTVNIFTVTTPSNSLTIPITGFTAADTFGVTGYLITTSATPPAAGAAGWTGTAPTAYTVASDGTYTLYPWAKDAVGNVSAVFGSPSTVVVDTTAPTVNTFTVLTPTNSLTIPITGFTATDAFGVTGYLITTSATPPAAGAAGWTGTAPTAYTVASDGTYTLYPWAKDAVDNVSAVFGSPSTVVVDTTAPTVNTFTVLTPSNSLTIPITGFTAADAFGVTGYLITTSAMPPAAGAAGWTGTAPTAYTVASDGTYTLYPWAKDAVGNVSAVFGSPSTVVVDTTAPTVNTFTVLTPSNSLTIPITGFTAADAFGVTGYLITTSATPPAAGAAGWTGTAPTAYTVASDGTYTLYPWAKDAVGNVSAVFGSPRKVVVDTTARIYLPLIRR